MEKLRKKIGFTIVELVVVIVIIGILAAALIPTISSAVTKARRTADVTEMKRINVLLLAEEITIEELRTKKLQTSGWELAYSFRRNNVVIVTDVDGEDIIIETDEEPFKDQKADTYHYIRVSLLKDEDLDHGKEPDENRDPKEPDDGPKEPDDGSKEPDEGDPKEPDDGPKEPEEGDPNEPEQDTRQWWEKIEATALPIKGSLEYQEILQKIEIRIEDKTNFDVGYFERSNLQRVYLGADITDIPENAFKESHQLCEVKFAGEVKTIGERAFSKCESIKQLVLPLTVTSMGLYSFMNCQFDTLVLPCGIHVELAGEIDKIDLFRAEHVIMSGGEMQVDFSRLMNELFRKRSDFSDEPRVKKVTILKSIIGKDVHLFLNDVWKNVEVEMDQETYDSYRENHPSETEEMLRSIKILEENDPQYNYLFDVDRP